MIEQIKQWIMEDLGIEKPTEWVSVRGRCVWPCFNPRIACGCNYDFSFQEALFVTPSVDYVSLKLERIITPKGMIHIYFGACKKCNKIYWSLVRKC